MKKIVLTIVLAIVTTSTVALAQELNKKQWSIGVLGGINDYQIENYGGGYYTYFDFKTEYQVGAAFRYKWRPEKFLNYSLQAEVRYQRATTDVYPVWGYDFGLITIGFVDVAAKYQLGFQLSPIFRPFVQAGPNFSFTIGHEAELLDREWLPLNTFSMGLDTGVGFDLWRFQVQFNYRWGLTNLNAKKDLYENVKLKGYEVSIGFFF